VKYSSHQVAAKHITEWSCFKGQQTNFSLAAVQWRAEVW